MRKGSIPRIPFAGRKRFSRRDIVLTLAGLGLIYLYYAVTSSHGSNQDLESARLERYMNANQESKVWDVKHSFDWSNVKFKYPPGPNIPLPKGRGDLPRVQADFSRESHVSAEVREARRSEVRRVFKRSWASYRKHAWMRDALLPISGQGRDQFSGWAATLVDSLDTLWIMGLRDEFNEAVDAVATIDFGTSTNARVNMFETNIRYLGGLLAAYDLSKRSVLLVKAIELGDMLYAGFNTEKRMPVDFFDIEASKGGGGLPVEGGVVSASPGTLWMEFTRLSQITGDPKYYTAISKVVSVFEEGQKHTSLPGMWPTMVAMNIPNVVDGRGFTLGSGADSLYEYITKMYPMLGGKEARYKSMSIDWMDTAGKHMFYRPMLPDGADILLAGNVDLDQQDIPQLDPESEHLSCFIGGTYALGGKLFGRRDYVELGEKLALGCAYAYKIMPTGIMPERYNMVKCESRSKCPWNEAKWNAEKAKKFEWREGLPLGFTTCKDPRYILRPEAIESIFYLYRITGRREFSQIAWDMFAAVSNGTETEFANGAVNDVTSKKLPLVKEDYMEVRTANKIPPLGTRVLTDIQSFWLGETLKYFYLALSPPDLISLDEYVLNTEAHPFRMPR